MSCATPHPAGSWSQSLATTAITVRLAISCLLLLWGPGVSQATEYHVGKQGNDAHDGLAREKAFLTIQKGVSALEPGDTLTIAPGEYAENVRIENFGSPDKETLVRAEIPGTVLLRGDVEAPAFGTVNGRRYAHAADCDGECLAVIEADTLKILKSAAGIDALDISTGSFWHDPAAHKLYVSSSDFQAPEKHHYRVSVRRDHGFLVNNSQRIVIDGLAAAGFLTPIKNYVFLKANSGFMVIDSRNITIRRCTAFSNQAGITIHDGDKHVGDGNVVEHSRAFGNSTDGIACYYPNNTIFRDCVSFLNGSFGVNFYANRTGTVLFSRTLSWGNGSMDFQMKGAGLSGEDTSALAENCIGLNWFSVFNLSHCIVGGENFYRRGDHARNANPMSPDNIALPGVSVPAPGSSAPDVDQCLRELDAFKDKEFADPSNFDFRLQASSQFRGTGSQDSSSGPYPYEPNVYYVTDNGNDQADGLSMGASWKTLEHASSRLEPGDTLYLAGGRYRGDAVISVKGVTLRGRGLDPAIIDGDFSVTDSAGVTIERLQFTGRVHFENSRDIALANCCFAGPVDAAGVQGLKLQHAVVAEPLVVKGCSQVFASGNMFAGLPGIRVDRQESLVYSAYNSYADAANCLETGGRKIPLVELWKEGEWNARVIKPDFSVTDGVMTVKNAHQFVGRGPLGTSIGFHRDWSPLSIRVVGPKVHSVTDTTANIEWWTSCPARVEVRWGDTPECGNSVFINQTDYFSYSLVGLEPGRKYWVKIKPIYTPPDSDPGRRVRGSEQASAEATFTADAKSATPRTYFVTPAGNDDHDGSSRDTAWKSLQHAADTVRPGDTVLVGGGEYKGTVFFPRSGEKNRPITVKAIPGEKAVIVGGGFTLNGKHHYRIDSLYFKDHDGNVIVANHGSHLEVTRCFREGGWGVAITANGTPDILIKNCAFFPGIGAFSGEHCPNLRIENNVIFGTMINHVMVVNAPNEPFTLRNNIFGESTRGKQYAAAVTLLQATSMIEGNNCFFQRWPEQERNVLEIWELSGKDRNISPLFDVHPKDHFVNCLPVYRAVVRPTDSFAANPHLFGGTGTRQGWGPGVAPHEFDALFTVSPELVKRGIGLQPEAFRDFHFKMADWPYDEAWADKVQAARKAAADLVKAGNDSAALTAYIQLAAMPMRDRLKSEFLEEAAMCANRLGRYEEAVAIAAGIPIEAVAATCQMRIMVANGKHAELLAKFADKPGAGTPCMTWFYPEQDDLLVEAYGYRAIAHAECNDLKSAEQDLKTLIEAQTKLGMFSSRGIQDLAWLKLGDFYRKYLKDDTKALEAYTTVTSRTFIDGYGNVATKPVLLGTSAPLAEATQAAGEILVARGKEAEAMKLRRSLLVAQGNAFAILDHKKEAVAAFKEAEQVEGLSAPEKEEIARKLATLQGDASSH
jgi:hypothetical protein